MDVAGHHDPIASRDRTWQSGLDRKASATSRTPPTGHAIPPVTQDAPGAPLSRPERRRCVSTQPLVLVADDEPRITKLVSLTLGEEGFRVITASGGADALAKA